MRFQSGFSHSIKNRFEGHSKISLQNFSSKIQLKGMTPDSTPRLHSILYTMPGESEDPV